MFLKTCYQCQRPSYSSSKRGQWLCSTCGYDLTGQRAYNATSMERYYKKIPQLEIVKK
ncbi:hypothetical protein [Bacillus sp. CECT 9360]|uniref:hypothetical protein n=1 Tax=Bacillus sp. CECT 9360 TaxID=2845821 RepID=UPI001E52A856|nr:hypothetical protein [Bacillus sp. CECT 9360]